LLVSVPFLGVLGHQTRHEGDVLLLGSLAALALLVVPGLPLGLALEVQETRLGGIVVAHTGLLEQGVQLQELVVAGTLGQALHLLGGGVELLGKNIIDICITVQPIYRVLQSNL